MSKKLTIWMKIIIGMIAVIVLAIGGALTYRFVKTQGVAEDYVVNSQIDTPRLVIATQKSKFKDEVVRQVVEKLKKQNIKISVTDVTNLSKLNDSQWDGLIILTTVESGQIQEDSHKFLENHQSAYKRIRLIYTADSNLWKHKDINIDAISSASIKKNIGLCVRRMVNECIDVLGV